jgi:hypothetical protein
LALLLLLLVLLLFLLLLFLLLFELLTPLLLETEGVEVVATVGVGVGVDTTTVVGAAVVFVISAQLNGFGPDDFSGSGLMTTTGATT